MKKVILCSLLLFLSGCGLFKSNEPTKIEVAQIDANNVVDSFFKEYKPIKESEIITTKYVIYVFSISDNSYNQNIDNMLLEKISKKNKSPSKLELFIHLSETNMNWHLRLPLF